MSTGQYYDKVSEHEDAIDLDQPEPQQTYKPKWSWSQQSLLIRTIIIATYTVAIAVIFSAIVEYRHNDLTTAAPATVTVTATAVPHAEVKPETDGGMTTTNFTIPASADGADQIQHCGGNAAEARALGCVYDVMMQLWMPAACYDSTLTEKFLLMGNWTWWADDEAKVTMTDEQMRKGEHEFAFMLQDYHKHHCVFAMEKLVRALRNKSPLIPELVSYDHIVHCRHKTLFRTDAVRGVRAPTGFTACAPYSVWKNNLPDDHVSSTE